MSVKDFKGSQVEVRNGDIDGALRRLKKLLQKEDWAKEVARTVYFEKPSETRKRKASIARKNWSKKRAQLESSGQLIMRRSGLKHLKSTRTRKKDKIRQDRIESQIRKSARQKNR